MVLISTSNNSRAIIALLVLACISVFFQELPELEALLSRRTVIVTRPVPFPVPVPQPPIIIVPPVYIVRPESNNNSNVSSQLATKASGLPLWLIILLPILGLAVISALIAFFWYNSRKDDEDTGQPSSRAASTQSGRMASGGALASRQRSISRQGTSMPARSVRSSISRQGPAQRLSRRPSVSPSRPPLITLRSSPRTVSRR